MAEKTVPWWRRALNYALEGIRGLFPRAVKPHRADEPEPSKTQEEPVKEERVLTLQSANLEAIAAAAPATPEPATATVPEFVSAPQPELVAISDPLPAPEPIADIAAEAVPAPEITFQPAPANEPVADAIVEAPVEAEPAPEVPVAAPALPVDVPLALPDARPFSASDVSPVDTIASQASEATIEAVDAQTPVLTQLPEDDPKAEPPAVALAGPEPAEHSVPDPDVAERQDASPSAIETEPDVEPASDFVSVSEQETISNIQISEQPEYETEFPSIAEPEPEQEAEGLPEADPELISEPEAAAIDTLKEEAPINTSGATEQEPVSESIPMDEPVLLPEPPPSPASAAAAATQEVTPSEPIAAPETTDPQKLAAKTIQNEKAAAKLAARQKKLDNASEQSPFSIIVGQVYDGPLDLLLDLIRQQDIDIYDIPIATITAQFLAYVNQLKASDVDVAGEFIYTASMLIHIKSKMLLPRSNSGPDDAAEDPRRELVERLLEHERFKNAAQMLQQKQMLEAATWTNPGFREFKDDAAAEPEIAADTVDLVRIFRDILERARNRPVFNVEDDSVTVGQMMQFLARRLTMEDKPVALRRLLSHTRSERALIAMFLALLELVRLQAILLRQDRAFSDIFIKKHTAFESVMNEGLANTPHDDWR